MDDLNGLGVAWVALAHTPRDDEGHVYGAQQFDAAADLTVRMYTETNNVAGPSLGIALRVIKTNDTGHPNPRLIVFEFNEYGLRNAFRPDNERGFPDLMLKARS